MKNSKRIDPKIQSTIDKHLDEEIVPGISMREMMKDDEMRDIMIRMIKAELGAIKK